MKFRKNHVFIKDVRKPSRHDLGCVLKLVRCTWHCTCQCQVFRRHISEYTFRKHFKLVLDDNYFEFVFAHQTISFKMARFHEILQYMQLVQVVSSLSPPDLYSVGRADEWKMHGMELIFCMRLIDKISQARWSPCVIWPRSGILAVWNYMYQRIVCANIR